MIPVIPYQVKWNNKTYMVVVLQENVDAVEEAFRGALVDSLNKTESATPKTVDQALCSPVEIRKMEEIGPGVYRAKDPNPRFTMKVLVAPHKCDEGKGPKDFCWTEPGEILCMGMKCSSGKPDDGCGCCRDMTGLVSRSGTTIGVVSETMISPEVLGEMSLKRFGIEKPSEEAISGAAADFEELALLLDEYPLGTRVSFAHNPNQGTVEIFEAGSEEREWGV